MPRRPAVADSGAPRAALSRAYSAPAVLAAAAAAAPAAPDRARPAPRRVLVFTVSAGGGHLAAAAAVQAALGAHHEVIVERPVETGAREYNQLLAHGWNAALNAAGALQDVAEQLLLPLTAAGPMGAALDRHRPDLLISVLPHANAVAWRLCRQRRIPMLLVPTDLRLDHFVKHLGDVDAGLRVALPFEDVGLRQQLGERLASGHAVVLGYPVRPEFGSVAAAAAPAAPPWAALGIGVADPVVLMMMGATGASPGTMLDDARALCQGLRGRPDRVHLVMFCGHNAALRGAVEALAGAAAAPGLRLHALGFTAAAGVAALMRRAAVIVTKTGGGTVNEALACGLPILFRSGGEPLWWESGNAEFVVRHGLGAWTDGGADLVGQVSQALAVRRPPLAVCPARSFAANLQRCAAQMLAAAA